MDKEVNIIIVIQHNKTCTMGLTAITIDTKAQNIPSAIKFTDTLVFRVDNFKHNITKDYEHEFKLTGKVEKNKNIKLELCYTVENEDLINIANMCKVTNLDSLDDKNIIMIKYIIDNFDPLVMVTGKQLF